MIRRPARLVLMVVLAALISAIGYWAGTNAVSPPSLPPATAAAQLYTVAEGSVARAVDVAVTAEWITESSLFASRSGTVTSIRAKPGQVVDDGDVVATIDLQPVVVADGAVPMFRPMARGTRGADVRQLETLLRKLGFLHQRPDARFTSATTAAVKRWQRSLGTAATGVVQAGALVFVEHLPVRIAIVPHRGQPIGPSDTLIDVFGSAPRFTATVGSAQRPELATGMDVAIRPPGTGTWHGAIGTLEPLGDGRFSATLTGNVCGQDCAAIAVGGQTALGGKVVLVPETRGVIVPTSAITQGPSGALSVTGAGGETLAVTVVAAANGFAVVDGLPAGTIIQLPAPPSP